MTDDANKTREMSERIARVINPAPFLAFEQLYQLSISQGDNEKTAFRCAEWVCGSEIRKAIRTAFDVLDYLRDNLTDQMRFAVWFEQYKYNGASDADAAILATKRFVDEEQKAQDIKAFSAMMDAARYGLPENVQAAFAGADR
ncbi:hypothetical protein ACT6QH_02115 [Xanthobacter sp. TB0139]|uniref:hypothetical protein n=1 Tax=Xanthobacter sp. TB0139 TaxID=3459178 RepID=UPI00403A625D